MIIAMLKPGTRINKPNKKVYPHDPILKTIKKTFNFIVTEVLPFFHFYFANLLKESPGSVEELVDWDVPGGAQSSVFSFHCAVCNVHYSLFIMGEGGRD